MTQFSSRDVPWMIHHAKVVDEAVTAAEAMQLAGLGWHVEVRRDGFQTAAGNWRVDPDKRKIVRADTEQPLGTVAPSYQVLQYDEAFDFMDQIHPEFVAAGELKHGKQAFLVVKAPDHLKLPALDGEDPHDLYVVMRTSHDGSRAVELNVLPLRDKCTNMMPLATFGKDAPQRWAIRHTKNMREKLEQAKQVLTRLDAYTEAYNTTAKRLAEIDLELDEARRVIGDVVVELNPNLVHVDKQVNAIMDVYEHSSMNGFQGTGWGLLNGVTEYFDHFRGGDDRASETRWVQGLDGTTTRAVNRTVERLQLR